MFISISYVCVFVQYHQMAIPVIGKPSGGGGIIIAYTRMGYDCAARFSLHRH